MASILWEPRLSNQSLSRRITTCLPNPVPHPCSLPASDPRCFHGAAETRKSDRPPPTSCLEFRGRKSTLHKSLVTARSSRFLDPLPYGAAIALKTKSHIHVIHPWLPPWVKEIGAAKTSSQLKSESMEVERQKPVWRKRRGINSET